MNLFSIPSIGGLFSDVSPQWAVAACEAQNAAQQQHQQAQIMQVVQATSKTFPVTVKSPMDKAKEYAAAVRDRKPHMQVKRLP